MTESLTPPDGIDESHQRPMPAWRRRASPFSILAFGVVVALGLSGVLGHERDWREEANGTALEVHAPEVTRNGEFLEMRIRVTSAEALAGLEIGIEAALWEDLTVNTMIPAATDETSEDGELRFAFSPLDAGTEFLWKVDLQVNPDIVIGNEGAITVYDGEEELVSAEISITVLP